GVVGLHAAILLAPAVEGLLADGQLLADLADGQAANQFDLGGAQLGDDLLGRVPRHRSSPRPQGPSETLIPPGPVSGEQVTITYTYNAHVVGQRTPVDGYCFLRFIRRLGEVRDGRGFFVDLHHPERYDFEIVKVDTTTVRKYFPNKSALSGKQDQV